MISDWAKSVYATFITTASVHCEGRKALRKPASAMLPVPSSTSAQRVPVYRHVGLNSASSNAMLSRPGRHGIAAVIPGTAASAGSL